MKVPTTHRIGKQNPVQRYQAQKAYKKRRERRFRKTQHALRKRYARLTHNASEYVDSYESFDDFCAALIQAWWSCLFGTCDRNGRNAGSALKETRFRRIQWRVAAGAARRRSARIYSTATVTLQRWWRRYLAANKRDLIEQRKARAQRSARKLQRAWRCGRDKQVFDTVKTIINWRNSREVADPYYDF